MLPRTFVFPSLTYMACRLEWIGVWLSCEFVIEPIVFSMHFTLCHYVPSPPIAEAFMRGHNPIEERMAAYKGFGKWWADTKRVLLDLRQLARVELHTFGHRVCLIFLNFPKPHLGRELQRIRAYVVAEFSDFLCMMPTGPIKLSIDSAEFTNELDWDPEMVYV